MARIDCMPPVTAALAPNARSVHDLDTFPVKSTLEVCPWLECSELYTCNFDLDWPMCGPLWSWACTGWCKIIRWPKEQ